jgi:hypothetical protein
MTAASFMLVLIASTRKRTSVRRGMKAGAIYWTAERPFRSRTKTRISIQGQARRIAAPYWP